METNIVVLDCQKMFVEGLDAYFNLYEKRFKISISVCSAEELQKAIQVDEFDILILELNIPDQDGLSLNTELEKREARNKDFGIIIIYRFKLVRNAMINGADGYVAKKSTFRELIYASRRNNDGNTYIGDGLRTSPAALQRRKTSLNKKRV